MEKDSVVLFGVILVRVSYLRSASLLKGSKRHMRKLFSLEPKPRKQSNRTKKQRRIDLSERQGRMKLPENQTHLYSGSDL